MRQVRAASPIFHPSPGVRSGRLRRYPSQVNLRAAMPHWNKTEMKRTLRMPRSLLLGLGFVALGCSGATEPDAQPSTATSSAALTWADKAKLLASDGASGDFMGFSSSISGNYALVGAPDDQTTPDASAAYLYQRGASGSWSEVAKLVNDDSHAGDLFGDSVAIDSDYALVGASRHTVSGSRGQAYVFERDTATNQWSQVAILRGSNGAGFATFGYATALSGSYAMIGAHADTTKGMNAGSAYVFERSGAGVWEEKIKLFALDATKEDEFGWSVSISGDYAIVGAPEDDAPSFNSGSAYVFERSAGVWAQKAKLLPGDPASSDNFGFSVSISGDYALIGAHGGDDKGLDSGLAYVFERDSTGTWAEKTKLVPADAVAGNNAGWSVSISGGRAVLGALLHNAKGSKSGAAYVFERNAAGQWTEQGKLVASDGDSGDNLGWSVGVDNTYVVAGALNDEDNGISSGAAYIFEGVGQGGAAGAGGTAGIAGEAGVAGSAGIAGSGGTAGTAGATASGGSGATGTHADSGATGTGSSGDDGGCACKLTGPAPQGGSAHWWALLALVIPWLRPRARS